MSDIFMDLYSQKVSLRREIGRREFEHFAEFIESKAADRDKTAVRERLNAEGKAMLSELEAEIDAKRQQKLDATTSGWDDVVSRVLGAAKAEAPRKPYKLS